MHEIQFIYADKCRDCNRAKKSLIKAISNSKKDIKIQEFNSETEEAVDLAVEYGIMDIPGCVIGDEIFFGKKGFPYKSILEAIEKLK